MPLATEVLERRPRLRDQVYGTILGEIRAGRLGEGEALVETGVAERLGVSRTPVREALFQLARDGLLVERGRGFRLPALALGDLMEIIDIRMALEPGIAAAAANAADRDDKAALKRELDAERAAASAADHGPFVEANLRFRERLISICPNRRLRDCVRLFNDQIQAARLQTLRIKKNRATVVGFHAHLVSAIRRGEAKRAEDTVRALLEAMRESFVAAHGDAT